MAGMVTIGVLDVVSDMLVRAAWHLPISTHEQLFAQPEYMAYESHIFALMREVTA